MLVILIGKKENKNICGLTYKNNDDKNEVELIYLVNILPQSLMYYVFNFGKLEKKMKINIFQVLFQILFQIQN